MPFIYHLKSQKNKHLKFRLNYLIIGSIPAIGWKHGSYGRKIEKARELMKKKSCGLRIVSESEFMEALVSFPEINSGEIDAKVIVCKYDFFTRQGEYDHEALEDFLEVLQEGKHCHVSVYVEDAFIYIDLFNEHYDTDEDLSDVIVVKCRIVKQVPLDVDSQKVVDDLAIGFEGIEGVDGRLHWFERKEGTASYIRLLGEIPQYKRSKTL